MKKHCTLSLGGCVSVNIVSCCSNYFK